MLRVLASHPQLQFFRGGSSPAHRRAYVEGVVASLLWAGRGWRRGVLHGRQFLALELEALLDFLYTGCDRETSRNSSRGSSFFRRQDRKKD